MRRPSAKSLLGLALGAAAVAGLVAWIRRPPRPAPSTPAVRVAPDPGPGGFARVLAPRPFRLPEDHGPHCDYQTEWWYYTGNLTGADGRRFGYQLTFFRRGLAPGPPPAGPGLSTNQIYFAHFGLTDAAAGAHRFAERFARGAAGLAGAEGAPFHVWLEGWRVEATNADGSAIRLAAREGADALELDLASAKPLVAHGDRGQSPKGEKPGNVSYYVGYTRLATRGRLTLGGVASDVTGESWFDHEWSTSALGPGAVGWDWFSLQMSDGRELMYFQIRRADGSLEPISGGTLIERDGRARRLLLADVRVEADRGWRSPETRAVYPSRWRLAVPSERLELVVEPLLADQEMRTSFVYWEGAVRVEGTRGGVPVGGHGYVELTGYARSMQGVF